ncbi:MAG: flagellar hook-associated protein FlgK [Rhodoferax sp.]|uniref:flagellar hook-associated protein FlgK n=1 Tax=Rhodoferax sp. TaxID=50421 RepID=UPI0030170DA3
MSGILNIGTRALQANQVALQTAGNNIANVNTPGYSRQSVVLQTAQGQNTGSGYIGKGVDVQTIQRNHNEFLTRQAALSSSTAASDTTRLQQLTQLENVFQGGANGLGAAVSDMLNSFSDVASAPTDLSARTVALTSADDLASRFRTASNSLDEIAYGVTSQLKEGVTAINNLAGQIAKVNEQISRAQGSGQTPNDLLDQRDQLIKNLNQYVQTTSIPADDGSVSIFLAGSQPLVIGASASTLGVGKDAFSDPSKTKLTLQRGGASIVVEESMLGGGQVSGLLKFQNTDLVDARNLLGRMALAIGTAVNDQHKLGVDLNGNTGKDLFSLGALPDGLASPTNTGTATLKVTVQTTPTSGSTAMVASNYEVSFSSANAGSITRLSDGKVTAFTSVPPLQIDGLNIAISAGTLAGGDRFLITPFSAVASNLKTALTSPTELAMSSPVAASTYISNKGTLVVSSLSALTIADKNSDKYTLTFTSATTYDLVDSTTSTTVSAGNTYIPGQAIVYAPTTTPGWSLELNGTPVVGDKVDVGGTGKVQANTNLKLNAGNAEAMMALRDVVMFEGAVLTDGFANIMSDIGVRVQSATSTAAVSESIATSIEKDRASVAGVNLDEEAAKLLQYQQAYQASAKMLQIAQSVFDTLMQTVAR